MNEISVAKEATDPECEALLKELTGSVGTPITECPPPRSQTASDTALSVSTGMVPSIIYNQCPIINAPDLVSTPIDPPPEVINGLLRQGHIGMMAAQSKAGKSWAVLALCLAVAAGKRWFGFETTKGRVLYINAELPDYDLQSRLKKLAESMGLDRVPDTLDIMHLRGSPKAIRELSRPIEERQKAIKTKYALVCPDPLYAFNGNDENDNSEMAQFMLSLQTLAEETDAAIWITHHFSKGNKANTEHIDRGSGAGSMARAVDCYMTLTRHQEDGAYVAEFSVRSFSTPDPFVVVFEYPLWRVELSHDPEDLKTLNGKPRKKKATDEEIALLLGQDGKTFTQWHKDCAETYHLSKSQFNRLRKLAESKGLIVPRGGRYFQISTSSGQPDLADCGIDGVE